VTKRSESVAIPVEGRLHWAWPNAEDVGFYQCNLEPTPTHPVEPQAVCRRRERIALLRDLWFQVRAGERSILEFLDAFAQWRM